jgi:hypothetical protein
MKTIVFYKKAIPIIFAAILLILATLLIYSNKSLSNKLSDEKLKSEILLSEKLSLDKLLSKNRIEMNKLTDKNLKVDKKLTELSTEIGQKQSKIEKLIAENKSFMNIKKQNEEMEAMLSQLNQKISELKKSEELAKNENKRLNDQLAYLSKSNSGLSADNSILKAIVSDNYRTEALRGKKEKLTIRASKTNKLMVSFDLPSAQDNNLYFKIVTPEGDEYSSISNAFAEIKVADDNFDLLASTDNTIIGNSGSKRMEMYYKPNQKLSKGVYQFNIYNGERFLGSTQLKLK